ncbi:hypothetical protein [Burkholderia pseudomallei]|uniref:hypothetical protein n=1 Tax=Burkholderia pseudomallei TaxID=28450 RepID=UPI0019FA619C|nr:hypothetical protein [Burkholderia pseudomallei]MBF3830797.1 hypothetical protein [Burkholderia pseudomallei]
MGRPAHANPSSATLRRRTNRAKWRDARRFTGFSFEIGMYDRAKADWEQHRERFGGTLTGRAAFTDYVAGALNAFRQQADNDKAAFMADYMNAEAARRADLAHAVTVKPDASSASAAAPGVDAADNHRFDFNSLYELSSTDKATA